MSQPTTTTTPATTPAVKEPSALAAFIKECEDSKTKPNETDKKKVGDTFKAMIAKRQKAEDALKAAVAEEDKISRDMVRCFGRKKVTIDGKDFAPTSRDERIFYKSLSVGSVEL